MRLAAPRAVLLLILVAAALRLLLAAIVDLGLDEAYAVAISRQFQLSWYDHPPMVFWIVGGLQAVFGPDVPGVVLRLPFIALSAGTTWMLYRLTARHFGDTAGLWAAALFTVAPFFFLSAGSWLVPDGPLVFFLLASALALSRVVIAPPDAELHWPAWLVAGAALGLALLSKYHAALFGIGVALYFAGAPQLRVWLTRPQPYVAAALALLTFSPVIVWNAQNEWASFAFQLGRGGGFSLAGGLRVLTVFALEAVYLLPTTAILLVAAIVWAVRAGPERRRSSWYFLALGLPAILVLDLGRMWSADTFAHWAMPGWMFLIPLAGGMLASLGRRLPRLTRGIAVLTMMQFGTVVVAVVLLVSDWRVGGIIPAVEIEAFRVEAGSWSGLAQGMRDSGALKENSVLAATSWRDASRVIEAVREPVPILVFEADPHGFAWVSQGALLGRDVLLVTRNWETAGLLASYAPYFESFELLGTYPTEPGNRHTMDVTLARDFRQPFPWPYGPD